MAFNFASLLGPIGAGVGALTGLPGGAEWGSQIGGAAGGILGGIMGTGDTGATSIRDIMKELDAAGLLDRQWDVAGSSSVGEFGWDQLQDRARQDETSYIKGILNNAAQSALAARNSAGYSPVGSSNQKAYIGNFTGAFDRSAASREALNRVLAARMKSSSWQKSDPSDLIKSALSGVSNGQDMSQYWALQTNNSIANMIGLDNQEKLLKNNLGAGASTSAKNLVIQAAGK